MAEDLEFKTPEEVMAGVAGIHRFIKANKENIERLPQLDKLVADLAAAQKAQQGFAARANAPVETLGGETEGLSDYLVRADDFDASNKARTYTAGDKTVTEEPGMVRLFGQSLTRESADGSQVEVGELPGYLDDPNPKSEIQKEIQRVFSYRAVDRVLRSSRNRSGRIVRSPHFDAQLGHLIKQAPVEVQRAFADSSTVGGEWIPDDYVPLLQTYIKGARAMGVGGLVEDIVVGRDTTIIPFLGNGFTPYVRGKTTSDDPAQFRTSSIGTDNRTVTVKTLAVRTQVDDEAAEDAYAFFMNSIFSEAAFALVSAEEDAFINGDTTASHQDTIATWTADGEWAASPGGGSDDHRRMALGLRARAVDITNSVDRSTFTFATWMADRATLKGPKGQPLDVAAIVNGTILATKLMTLAEVVTIEKFGANATAVSGEIARLGGVPLLESAFMTFDLAASGLYTGSGATGGYAMFKRSRFKRIVRRAVRFAVQRDETRGIAHHVWSQRGLPIFNIGTTSEKNVRYAYNMS